jgi:hypothetical protein
VCWDGDCKSDRRDDNGCGEGPPFSPAHPEPGQARDGQPCRSDEAAERDVQMADVVIQLRAERLDLRPPLVHLFGTDAQLQEGARKVEHQEDDGVCHEGQPGKRHESRSRP